MKFIISRSALLAAITPAATITNRRSPSPFGSCVRLTAAGSTLTVQARDAISAVRATAPIEAGKPGTIAVPAEDFLERVDAMADGPIALSYAKDRLTIQQGARVYTLRTLSAEGFPAFPAPPPNPITLPAARLSDALTSVAYAAGNDIALPQFCGVVVVANDVSLTTTAADGKRIARVSGDGVGAALNTFVPSSAMKALEQVLGVGGEVTVATSEALVYIKAGDVELAYQRPAVDAPKYEMVMGFLKAIDGAAVSRKDLLTRINAVTVDGTAGGAPVVLGCGGGILHLSHTSMDGDVSTDEVAAGEGWEWTVAAEATYLIEALRRLPGESVRVCVFETDMQQPIVLRGEGESIATIARINPETLKARAA